MSQWSVSRVFGVLACVFVLAGGESVARAARTAGGVGSAELLAVTTRRQFLQKTGRIRWAANEQTEYWLPKETAIIVVDMWDKHWCPSTTERVAALAPLINATLNNARELGIQIIHAPSECDAYYVNSPSRLWTLALPNVTMPNPIPHDDPPKPFDNGDCDVPGFNEHPVWTKEIDLITIHAEDALIEESDGGQTLWNLIVSRGLKHLVYVGVAENLCIMNRSFAVKAVVSWGMAPAVAREVTDTMYDPSKTPYCSHERSVVLMTEFIEKFWSKTVSVYDFLNPRNSSTTATC